MGLTGRSLTRISDLDDDEIRGVLDLAARMEADPLAFRGVLDGRIVCTAFYEPSTRTRLSFESAAHRLGADVIGFSDAQVTSTTKGETLEDTIRVLSGYADILVLRHPEAGAAARAAAISGVPVLNAGDGDGEHPTQTLLDLYTIRSATGGLEGRCVAVVGDLRYGRTVHSLVPALHRMGASVMQVPAPGLELPEGDVPVVDLKTAAAQADVLYVTRIQKERFVDMAAYNEARGALRVDPALLRDTASKAIVMHPLPRVDELDPALDALPAAKYFDQARNGVAVRMAILGQVSGAVS